MALPVVIDTNVLLAGVFWSGPPYKILKAWQARQIELIVSHEILEEYNRVFELLSKKYPPIELTTFIELVTLNSRCYHPFSLPKQICNDPDDDKFIACALSAGTKYIISGDKALLAVSGYQGIEIITPRHFIEKALI